MRPLPFLILSLTLRSSAKKVLDSKPHILTVLTSRAVKGATKGEDVLVHQSHRLLRGFILI